MNSADTESIESANGQGEDKNIIDKILGEMKSEFNKTEKEKIEKEAMDSSLSNSVEEETVKTEESTNAESTQNGVEENNEETQTEKPRIILSFKKPNSESPVKNKETMGRRSLRQKTNPEEKTEETGLKRSARRRSKDCNESVLQSAIARKEKSYNESNKPQRLTRQLKPTQKILENLALAKQEKSKSEKTKPKSNDKTKNNDSDSFTETDSSKTEDERIHRKHKHHNKHNKRAKKFKSDSSKDSDSDQSAQEEIAIFQNKQEEGFRRSRRISSSRNKDDSNTDVDEQSLQESVNDENACTKNDDGKDDEDELVKSRLCLCTEKTQYYLASNDEDTTYCAAVDNIGEKIVGCSRIVDPKEVMLMRPSTRVPYAILCEAHRNRLLRHNCCPTCGVFCTQGRFLECEAKHHYHRDCQISVDGTECCPHCGTATPSYEVTITMHSSKRPIFLPVQKAQ